MVEIRDCRMHGTSDSVICVGHVQECGNIQWAYSHPAIDAACSTQPKFVSFHDHASKGQARLLLRHSVICHLSSCMCPFVICLCACVHLPFAHLHVDKYHLGAEVDKFGLKRRDLKMGSGEQWSFYDKGDTWSCDEFSRRCKS